MFSPAQTNNIVAVRIAGRLYHVSSFREMAWNHEPVTVSILMKG
ncbi:MAG TPA: hypothetical protein VKB54_18255 [Solirubrobacteraceae bacterium]|nr:hypothetical protein [Solirubrobacteraceae bacterium]